MEFTKELYDSMINNPEQFCLENDVNEIYEDGEGNKWTAIYYAIIMEGKDIEIDGKVENIINNLIRNGADIEGKYLECENDLPIISAAKNEKFNSVKILAEEIIKKEKSLDQKDSEGLFSTVAYIVSSDKLIYNLELLKLFFHNGANFDEDACFRENDDDFKKKKYKSNNKIVSILDRITDVVMKKDSLFGQDWKDFIKEIKDKKEREEFVSEGGSFINTKSGSYVEASGTEVGQRPDFEEESLPNLSAKSIKALSAEREGESTKTQPTH